MIHRSLDALRLFVTLPVNGKVLDIGSEDGSHAFYMKSKGMDVITLDLCHKADIKALWPVDLDFKVGAIWCSHVLEHSRNPGEFMDAFHKVLIPDGWLAVTVPPMKNEIVGGHVSTWNAGLLMYHLILGGFDCREAKVKTYGDNVSVVVQRKAVTLPELKYDSQDIEMLARFFPIPARQGFNGIIEEWNWA